MNEYEERSLEFLKEKKEFDLEVRRNRENVEDLQTCIKKQSEDIVNLKRQLA